MKKKLVTGALLCAFGAVAVTGGTLAYFTDKDQAENVFTTGNVDIALEEVFDADNAKLIPGIDIQKEVDVRNAGSEEAYVRIHLAVPSMLDSGSEDQPQFAAYNNTLHWNFSKAAVADGLWNWHNENVNGASLPGWPGNGGAWNMYQQTIDGVLYNVYVATYETALPGATISDVASATTAEPAIHKVYLDKAVTNEMMAEITKQLGPNPKVLVVAEGGQVAGFNNAYDALNTQFGVPGTYNPWAK